MDQGSDILNKIIIVHQYRPYLGIYKPILVKILLLQLMSPSRMKQAVQLMNILYVICLNIDITTFISFVLYHISLFWFLCLLQPDQWRVTSSLYKGGALWSGSEIENKHQTRKTSINRALHFIYLCQKNDGLCGWNIIFRYKA